MAIPRTLPTLEVKKFCELNGEVAVRTCSTIDSGSVSIDPPITSRVTTMDVTDTAIPIPAIALPNRVAVAIYNTSTLNTLYYSHSATVTADTVLGITSGWEIGAQETANESISDAEVIYAIAETGKTIRIKVREWAKAP